MKWQQIVYRLRQAGADFVNAVPFGFVSRTMQRLRDDLEDHREARSMGKAAAVAAMAKAASPRSALRVANALELNPQVPVSRAIDAPAGL